MKIDISPKELNALLFVAQYKSAHPYSPSFEEIATAVKTRDGSRPASKSHVMALLFSLRAKGYMDWLIIKRKSSPRTAHLTDKGMEIATQYILPEKAKVNSLDAVIK